MAVVVGHHGTVRSVADKIVDGVAFEVRRNDYDWLGTGIYFWQDSELRARVWARSITRGTTDKPAVLAADLNLDGCLDLFDLRDYATLRDLYAEFVKQEGPDGPPLSQPALIVQDGKQFTTDDPSTDPLTRKPIHNFRDCAFLDWAVNILRTTGRPVHSIRGAFLAGRALFTESFLFDWSHSQIAVLEPEAVISNIRLV